MPGQTRTDTTSNAGETQIAVIPYQFGRYIVWAATEIRQVSALRQLHHHTTQLRLYTAECRRNRPELRDSKLWTEHLFPGTKTVTRSPGQTFQSQ